MSSEEYVNQVNRLMDLQINFLNIFLTFLLAILAIVFGLQWWINSKQMSNIKKDLKEEYKCQLNISLAEAKQEYLALTSVLVFNSMIDCQIKCNTSSIKTSLDVR